MGMRDTILQIQLLDVLDACSGGEGLCYLPKKKSISTLLGHRAK